MKPVWQRAMPKETKPIIKPKGPVAWGRQLAVVAAAVFVMSSVFPVVAGLSRDTSSFSKWWGIADVGTALLLGIVVMVMAGWAEGRVTPQAIEASYRAYRVLLHGILALVVVFFVAGDHIVWINCLTGFAWRAWVLLYGLPAWFTALRSSAGS
jgi:hypothetical protein